MQFISLHAVSTILNVNYIITTKRQNNSCTCIICMAGMCIIYDLPQIRTALTTAFVSFDHLFTIVHKYTNANINMIVLWALCHYVLLLSQLNCLFIPTRSDRRFAFVFIYVLKLLIASLHFKAAITWRLSLPN